MIMNVHDDTKTVEIWLTRAESRDEKLREELKPKYADFKAKKYFVAVFCSGEGDLADLTAGLLRHNLSQSARREVEAGMVI